jgi:drug/metabolite transporter (DMT)-like permease
MMRINQHPEDPAKAYIFAGLAVLFWSTAASAFKLTLGHTDFLSIVLIATLTSCIAFFLVLCFQGNLHLLRLTAPGELLRSAWLVFLNPFLYYIVLLKAYSILPAQVAQPLNFTWPIMLVILSAPLLGQRIRGKGILAMLISFSGVYLISSQGDPLDFNFSDPLGVTLALGSSFIWALFWIFSVRDRRNEVVKLFLSFLFASFYIGILMLFFSDFKTLNISGVTGAIYIGLFEMGFTFIFWLKALQYAVSSERVSNLIYITPFFSLLLINLILGEQIYITTFGGLVLIVSGIVFQKFSSTGLRRPGSDRHSNSLK